MLLQAPVKKSNYYYCKLTDNQARLFSLKIPFCSLQQAWLLSKQQGYLLHLRVPRDDFAKETIQELENFCIQELVKNNKKWFRNELEESKIQEMYDSCISQDVLHIYVSSLRSYLTGPGAEMGVCDWLENGKHKFPQLVQCTVVCDGLFIYPKKFGLRWVIREIGEYQEQEHEDILPEVQDIVEHWTERGNTFLQKLDEKIKMLMERREQVARQLEKIREVEIYQLEEEVEVLRRAIG